MEIGNQIKKHRSRLKWSQETLAEKAYVSRQTISNWENDKSYPDIHSLLILGKLFDISLDELVKGDVEAMKNEINKEEVKKFNFMSWVLTVEYIIMVLSAVPLIKLFGWKGWAIWAVIVASALLTAVKVEKMKKVRNISTYKEISAYMAGKPLEEISAERISNIRKTGTKVIYGVVSGMIGLSISLLIAFLMN